MVGAIKEQLGGKIMSEFVALGAKLCVYKQLDAEKHERLAMPRDQQVCGEKGTAIRWLQEVSRWWGECMQRADIV